MNIKEGIQNRILFIQKVNMADNPNCEPCQKEITLLIKFLEQETDMDWNDFLAVIETLAAHYLGMF